MNEDLVKCFEEDFVLLIEGGLIAIKQLDEVAAVRMFQAAEIIAPTKRAAAQLGMGYVELSKFNLKGAAKIFQEIIDKDPENYFALMFLGMSFLFDKGSQDKRKKGAKMIHEAMEKSTDPTVKTMGEAMMDWMDKQSKKGKGSFSI